MNTLRIRRGATVLLGAAVLAFAMGAASAQQAKVLLAKIDAAEASS